MISNFKEIRRDGNVIRESMTIEEFAARGWSPDKVTGVTWDNDGQLVQMEALHGVLAKTLPDRDGVAWMENADETGLRSSLSVLNADGSVRLVVPDTQLINGRSETGTYCWYEPARSSPGTHFGVVFRVDRNQAIFQLDIDMHSGTTAAVYPLR
jgi:hypothetical protein